MKEFFNFFLSVEIVTNSFKNKCNVFVEPNLTFQLTRCEQIIKRFSLSKSLICKQGLARFAVWRIQYWAKQHGQYRSDNFVIEYIEGAPCWVELVRGVRGAPVYKRGMGYTYNRGATGRWW